MSLSLSLAEGPQSVVDREKCVDGVVPGDLPSILSAIEERDNKFRGIIVQSSIA